MRILVIYNATDARCGFKNVGEQMVHALRRTPGIQAFAWDGTYTTVCARRGNRPDQTPDGFFPSTSVDGFDVIHVIWHAAALNHYSGANWAAITQPVISWWDGGPSDASCPFAAWMQVRWSEYPRPGYHDLPYPVPDWVDHLPPPDPAFTVGASSIRGDGIAEITDICTRHGWALNLPATDGGWLSVEDEIRRLARSTVNVCWYHTSPTYTARASAPSMFLAAGRPILINDDPLLTHLHAAPDLYHAVDLEPALEQIHHAWHHDTLQLPTWTAETLSWTRAAAHFVRVWQQALETRR